MANTRNNEGYFDPTANAAIAAVERTEAQHRRKAKSYLSQAYRIDSRINSKIEQVASLRDLANQFIHRIVECAHLYLLPSLLATR